ncbi:MAG: Ig-like domain-containing protein, partial [Chitinophagales bacterium]
MTILILLGFLATSQAVSAQPATYDLQFANAITDCENNSLCLDLQIKSADSSTDFAMGSHTMWFGFNTDAVNNATFIPLGISAEVACEIGSTGITYSPFAALNFSSTSGEANFTTTLNTYIAGSECPIITSEWFTMGNVCFDIVAEGENPELIFNESFTLLNQSDEDPVTPHTPGTWTPYNTLISCGMTAVAPDAVGDDIETNQNTAVSVDVLANDTGENLTIVIAMPPSNGTTVVEEGMVVYTPNTDFIGADFFNYTITDSETNLSSEATVLVTVLEQVFAPIALDNMASTEQGVAVVTNVLNNDIGSSLELVISTIPNNGTAIVTAGESITYTPNPDFVGTDTVVYTITDTQTDLADEALLVITVTESSVAAGSINGLAFNDLNEDGIPDANEQPVEGVIISIILPNNTMVFDTTDANGIYEFTGLEAGDYQLTVVTIPMVGSITTE